MTIGASGLVFTYFGWLIARAVRERSMLAIGLGVLVLVLYGGILWRLSPFQLGISWQGHLGGLATHARGQRIRRYNPTASPWWIDWLRENRPRMWRAVVRSTAAAVVVEYDGAWQRLDRTPRVRRSGLG